MGRSAASIVLLAFLILLPTQATADTSSETHTSIEVWVDTSDVIVLAEIAEMKEPPTIYSKVREYRVVEVLKSNGKMQEGKILVARNTRGEPKDRVMIFLTADEDVLKPVRVISFSHPSHLAYDYNHPKYYQSKLFDYLAIDRWGYIIEHPDRLIAAVKERVAHNRLHPPAYSIKGAKNYRPPDWDYDDGGYDIIMDINVPPDDAAKQDPWWIPPERIGIEVAPDIGDTLSLIRNLNSKGSTRFTHARFDDRTLGEKYRISSCGKYCVFHEKQHKQGRAYVYEIASGEPVLALKVAYAGESYYFTQGGKYFVWRSEQRGYVFFDLAKRKEGTIIPESMIYQWEHYYNIRTFYSEDDRMMVNAKFSGGDRKDSKFRAWNLETGKLLTEGRGIPKKISPAGHYLTVEDERSNDMCLIETTTGKRLWVLDYKDVPLLFAPDDSVAVHLEPIDREIVRVIDPRTGKTVKEMNLSFTVGSLEVLDKDTILATVEQNNESDGITDAIILNTKPDDATFRSVKYKRLSND